MGNPWPNGKFTFDLSDNEIFRKDEANYIDALGIQQLNTIGNIYFLDIFLSKDNYVDLHYHPNASELTYCISGGAVISFINPTLNEWQNYTIKPGDAVSIPQGFFHMAQALTNDTHLLATHDTDNLKTVFGSDIFRIVPPEDIAGINCLNEAMVAETFAPITGTNVIGPPVGCERPESMKEMAGSTTEGPIEGVEERSPENKGKTGEITWHAFPKSWETSQAGNVEETVEIAKEAEESGSLKGPELPSGKSKVDGETGSVETPHEQKTEQEEAALLFKVERPKSEGPIGAGQPLPVCDVEQLESEAMESETKAGRETAAWQKLPEMGSHPQGHFLLFGENKMDHANLQTPYLNGEFVPDSGYFVRPMNICEDCMRSFNTRQK